MTTLGHLPFTSTVNPVGIQPQAQQNIAKIVPQMAAQQPQTTAAAAAAFSKEYLQQMQLFQLQQQLQQQFPQNLNIIR